MIYDYKCPECGSERDSVYNTIAERHTQAPECCSGRMEIIHKVAPMGFVDREIRYICPVTGDGVTTRKQRNEIMAREGLVDANDFKQTFEQRAAAKAKKQAELKAIEDEIPKELKSTMQKHIKKRADEFKASV